MVNITCFYQVRKERKMSRPWRKRFKVGHYKKAYKKARFKRMFARNSRQCIRMFADKGVKEAQEMYDRLYGERSNS